MWGSTYPSDQDSADRTREFLAINIGMAATAMAVVSLRVWVRARLVKAIGLDDYLIIAAMAMTVVMTVLMCLGMLPQSQRRRLSC